ncbi:MAG: glycosyltransferase family 4 protein [Spirochaetia bacterium]|nr:glycosyltransferase family 4 protein [Spirochaetia bacterium]
MRIVFIVDNFPPEYNAPATRTFEHCREWVKKGDDVTVITCEPNFPGGVLYPGYSNKIIHREMMEGIRVIRVWSYIAPNAKFIKRIVDYLSFSVSAFLFGLSEKCDLIIATSPQFFTTWAAFLLSHLKKVPWLFELRDLWPESIVAVGAMKKKPAIRMLELIELGLYKDAHRVVALTDAFKKNLVRRGIDATKIEVIPNGSNLDLFYPREKNPALLGTLGLAGKFVVGYIGTIGMAHGLDLLIKDIAEFKDKDTVFLFIGDGATKRQLVAQAHNLKTGNIIFLDAVSKEKVADYLSLVDVSLVPLKREAAFKNVIPSKIFESAAMGIPILLGVEGQALSIVEDFRAGVGFIPEDGNDMLNKLLALKTDTELFRRISLNCLALARAYDRSILAENMRRVLHESAKTERK